MSREKATLFGAVNKILSDQSLSREEKSRAIIHATGIACGIIALQPIPFADIFVLTPIQAVMFLGIGKLYGFEISAERAKEIVLEIAGVIGMGLIAQHSVIALYKTVIPFAGGLFTIPLVWAFTFGMGRVGIYYFERRAEGQEVDRDEMKRIFERGKAEGKAEAKHVDVETIKTNFEKMEKH